MNCRFRLATSLLCVIAAGCATTPRHAIFAKPGIGTSSVAETANQSVRQPTHKSESPTRSELDSQSGVRLTAYTSDRSEQGTVLPGSPGTFLGSATSLDDLIAFALANNPEIQAILLQAHALEARVPQVRALDDPMLMTTTFLEPIQTAAGPQDVTLNISQKLPWFGKRALRGEVACQEAQAAFARMAAAQLSVVEQVKLAYYELYFVDRALAVNKELESRLEDVVAIAETKYTTAREKTGMETVLQAQVELSQLQTVLIQLDQAKVKAHARLAKALHAPRGASLEVVPSIPDANVPRSAEILVALIDQCQPKLDAVRRERIGDQAAIALAQKNYFPDVTVGLNYYGIGATGLSPLATGNDSYSMLVGVNLPIYKEKLDAGVREAQFRAARTAQQYEALWDEVRAEVQTQHAQAIEDDRIVQILEKNIIPKSQETLALSFEAYRVDRITFQQLIENYKTLLRHRIDYHRRLAQRAQAIATLERAVGCAITTWPIDLEDVPSGPESPKLQ